MAWFGKKKEKQPAAGSCCCGGCPAGAAPGADAPKVESASEQIEVLGSGCKNCHTLWENTCKAVEAMGLQVEVQYVTDLQRIAASGIMSMPALLADGKVLAMGRVLRADEVEQLLRQAGYGA